MLNDAQNAKLLSKLRRAMEVFEPYIFTKVAQLPFAMYETAERLEKSRKHPCLPRPCNAHPDLNGAAKGATAGS